MRYCAALANEGGGRLVLGITDKRPRRIIGSQAFADLNERKLWLLQKLHLRIDADAVIHGDGRVVVFSVPSRPIGVAIATDGDYVMRSGESVVSMTPERLRFILDEAGPDFSAEICSGAELPHLDPRAIDAFCKAWIEKSENKALAQLTSEQLLRDAELVVDGGVTYAALALLGEHRALGRFLADAEIIFEWRLRDNATKFDQRREFRKGFFLCFNNLWNEINARNQVHQYQDGLFRYNIPTFRENVIREAILNAVAHRDYRTTGSIFIKQSPTILEIANPGGFPEGITAENIVWKQKPRNRRIAETLGRCGFVERSGQGANLMFEWSVRDAKPLPDYSRSDSYEVVVRLDGQVRDEQFVKFLEKISAEQQISFGVEELLTLARVRDGQNVGGNLAGALQRLLDMGAVERVGRRKLVLSRRYYEMVGRKGEYTRKRGPDRETHKALLLKHIEDNRKAGSTAREFQQVLPNLSRNQIYFLIKELYREKKIDRKGDKRGAVWFPWGNDGEE